MLSAFPHLTDSEFEEACGSLVRKFHQKGHAQSDWLSVEKLSQHETVVLRITKPLPSRVESSTDDENEFDHIEVTEDDEEVLVTPLLPQPTIHYDILLSPTYSVPVLYIRIHDTQHRYPPTMEILYRHLVPAQFKAHTEDVGVMGGITVTDHPVGGRPVFFIHPCRTAEVLEASIAKERCTETKGAEYLMVWMGALGRSVGLNVPLALATQPTESQS
jgi:ubiquitin-like-conjugating enzyme ATG10